MKREHNIEIFIIAIIITGVFSAVLVNWVEKPFKPKNQTHTFVSIGQFKDLKNMECSIDKDGHLLIDAEKWDSLPAKIKRVSKKQPKSVWFKDGNLIDKFGKIVPYGEKGVEYHYEGTKE